MAIDRDRDSVSLEEKRLASGLLRRMLKLSDLDRLNVLEVLCNVSPWNRDFLAQELLSGGVVGLIDDNGELIGFFSYRAIAEELHILNLGIHPTKRSHGIGSEFVRSILDEFFAEETLVAHLEVRISNVNAQRFYQNLGFDIVGQRDAYYRSNGEAAILMTLNRLTYLG